jgi:hypothetical protein
MNNKYKNNIANKYIHYIIMSIFDKLSIICYILVNISNVYGKNISSIDYKKCTDLNSLLLCDNINKCPDDYHICNAFDTDVLFKNEYYLTNIKNVYLTNIGSNDEKCELCSENKYNNIITLSQLYNNQLNSNDSFCMINNKRIKNNNGVKINNCMVCVCNDKQTKCINTCNYNANNNFITTMDNDLDNCIGIKESIHELKCMELYKQKEKNLACCINNACTLKNCKSCMNFGINEVCNECESNYYFNTYSRNKCHSLDKVGDICNRYYYLDKNKQTFTCSNCINGNLVYNNSINLYKCECKEGYFGHQCDKNYNLLKCSGNGRYNKQTNKCECDEGFSGEMCKNTIENKCIHGFFNRDTQRCVCRYSFYGKHCDKKIQCMHGNIIFNKCICDEGFSGIMCNIPLPERNYIRARDIYSNILINSNYLNPCKNGVMIDNKCSCFSGYTGNDCSQTICKNGDYNEKTETCECVNGYYGKKCEYNCFKKCSYNGNICKTNNIGSCVCNNGWYGRKCEKFIPNIYYYKGSFLLSNSIRISYRTRNFIFSLKILANRLRNVLPFRINYKNIYKKRFLKYNNIDNLIINTTLGLTNNSNVYYIYPNNDYSKSYYSGRIINITHIDNVDSYYIYIEKIRVNDSNNFLKPNYNLTELNNNSHISSDTYKNSMWDNYWIITTIIIVIITIIFIIRKYKVNSKIDKKHLSNKNEFDNKNLVINNNPIYSMHKMNIYENI